MVYLDANVFLYPMLYDPATEPKAKRARDLLTDVVSGKIRASTSTLTWDEVVWVIWRLVGRPEAVRAGTLLLRFPNLRFVEVTGPVITKAQEVMTEYGLRPRDSIHVASALIIGDNEIVSDDVDFDRVDIITRIPL